MKDDVTIFAEGLSRGFGTVWSVREAGLSVRRGEIFGLVGPDGAGKSTMMRMLAGVLRPDAGRIFIAGVDIPKRRRKNSATCRSVSACTKI
jgi:ABC-2 type transport system ATP-binding protein